MPKQSKSTIDPSIQQQIDGAIGAIEDVIVVEISALLESELKANQALLMTKENPEFIMGKAKTYFEGFVKKHIPQEKRKELEKWKQDPLFAKVLSLIVNKVGEQFNRSPSRGFISMFGKFTSTDQVLMFFQVRSLDETRKIVNQLKASFNDDVINQAI